jgi:hypothetical protein
MGSSPGPAPPSQVPDPDPPPPPPRPSRSAALCSPCLRDAGADGSESQGLGFRPSWVSGARVRASARGMGDASLRRCRALACKSLTATATAAGSVSLSYDQGTRATSAIGSMQARSFTSAALLPDRSASPPSRCSGPCLDMQAAADAARGPCPPAPSDPPVLGPPPSSPIKPPLPAHPILRSPGAPPAPDPRLRPPPQSRAAGQLTLVDGLQGPLRGSLPGFDLGTDPPGSASARRRRAACSPPCGLLEGPSESARAGRVVVLLIGEPDPLHPPFPPPPRRPQVSVDASCLTGSLPLWAKPFNAKVTATIWGGTDSLSPAAGCAWMGTFPDNVAYLGGVGKVRCCRRRLRPQNRLARLSCRGARVCCPTG